MQDTAELLKGKIIFEKGTHKVVWLGWDEKTSAGAVQTNQYLIISGGRGILLDPGGVHLFSRVVASLSNYINIEKIDTILFSHQDPDVSSGIALWLGITNAKIFLSELWLRFMPHFGIVNLSRLSPIPDDGLSIPLAGGTIGCIPAHFLHSPGNFSFYDSISEILFSGDVGAAVFPENKIYLYAEDFDSHLRLMEGFHKRYMASGEACRRWVRKVREKNISQIAPQHGAIMAGEPAKLFLSWLENLKCGIDLLI